MEAYAEARLVLSDLFGGREVKKTLVEAAQEFVEAWWVFVIVVAEAVGLLRFMNWLEKTLRRE